MSGLSEIWNNPEFREWVSSPANVGPLSVLRLYVERKAEAYHSNLIKAGDTDFAKGQYDAVMSIISDLKEMQKPMKLDTKAETAQPTR